MIRRVPPVKERRTVAATTAREIAITIAAQEIARATLKEAVADVRIDRECDGERDRLSHGCSSRNPTGHQSVHWVLPEKRKSLILLVGPAGLEPATRPL